MLRGSRVKGPVVTNEEEPATPNPLATGADDGAARVLLMRHGQTHANAQGFFLGRRDEGVTGLGEEQSRRAVAGLVAWRPDRIICSPLKRCKALIAEPAAREIGIESLVDERLFEFDFGPLEGMTFDEVIARDLPFPWGPRAAAWPPAQGGESFDDFLARIGDACDEIERLEGRTAIVVHGGVIRGFLGNWLNMGTDEVNHLIVRNVDGFVFRVRPGFAELESYGIHPEDLADY